MALYNFNYVSFIVLCPKILSIFRHIYWNFLSLLIISKSLSSNSLSLSLSLLCIYKGGTGKGEKEGKSKRTESDEITSHQEPRQVPLLVCNLLHRLLKHHS
jgi:hypothetical protein